MILFTILICTLVVLVIATVLAFSIFGGAAIIVFGDVIVCGIIIVWLIKKLFFKKKK